MLHLPCFVLEGRDRDPGLSDKEQRTTAERQDGDCSGRERYQFENEKDGWRDMRAE